MKLKLIKKTAPAFIVLGVLVFLTWGQRSNLRSLDGYATNILSECSQSDYRPGCYEKEVPKLMNRISMEEAFQVTRLIQQQDSSFAYCHVLGHNLSAQEVSKDPSKWKEVVTRCPSGLCSNGCIHGGFQERFRSDSLDDAQIKQLKPDLISVCQPRQSWHPTDLEKSSCYHALGHLAMYITRADINKSLSLCSEITAGDAGNDNSQVCDDGVFMQIFQPLEPEDFALVKGKVPSKSNIQSFCRQFANKAGGSCLTEAWPLSFSQISTPTGLTTYCSQADISEQDRCFLSLEYVIVAQFKFDLSRLKNFCQELPINRSGACFAHVSSRLIETDFHNISKSVAFCAEGLPFDPENLCYKELLFYSTFNFHPGSVEQKQLCQELPEVWAKKCNDRASSDHLGKI